MPDGWLVRSVVVSIILKPLMRRALIFVVSLLLLPPFGQAQNSEDEIHLRATVQSVVSLTSFAGHVTPVDIDPRFALTLHVESVIPAVPNFSEGALVIFAIHSPSLLFAGEPTKGKTYDFSVRREIHDGKVKFRGLEIVAPTEPLCSWFGNCNDKEYMGLEVLLSGKTIHRSSFPVCRISDLSEELGPKQKTLAFSFKGGHVFQGEYATRREQTIEVNVWQAGADPGAILFGVSFTSKNQVLLNTIHIAKPGRATTTEIDRGLLVRTFPTHRK